MVVTIHGEWNYWTYRHTVFKDRVVRERVTEGEREGGGERGEREGEIVKRNKSKRTD